MISDHLTSIYSVIDSFFTGGISASDEILSFAESTLGIDPIKDLSSLLSSGDPDLDGLLDLLFSPDQELKMSMEPFIQLEGINADDVSSLRGMILEKHNTVMVMLGVSDINVPVILTEPLLNRFLCKLNLEKSISSMNTGDLPSIFSEEDIMSFRVLLRHSRYHPSAYSDMIIISLLNGLVLITGGHKPVIVHDCLSHLLELFSENPEHGDLRSLLSMKMRYYRDMLEKAAQFGDYLGKYTMEFLMSQKIQPPTINVEEIRKKMHLTDLISTAVFEEPVDDGPRELTVRYDR